MGISFHSRTLPQFPSRNRLTCHKAAKLPYLRRFIAAVHGYANVVCNRLTGLICRTGANAACRIFPMDMQPVRRGFGVSETTKIEWCDHTFNPWVGCLKVSPGCDHCYAESWAKRSGLVEWGGPRRRTSPANWRRLIKWHSAVPDGERRRVFCASLADVFDNEVPPEWRADLFSVIRATPNFDWLLLTKRIGNAKAMLPADWGDGYHNVQLGSSVVNQAEADRDIPKLLRIPAYIHFLSCEPLLGPVDLDCVKHSLGGTSYEVCSVLEGDDGFGLNAPRNKINWVIVGGESGHGARPMEIEWARSLKIQCAAAGTAFFMKQGSQSNWPDFKNFANFPPSLQVREWPVRQ